MSFGNGTLITIDHTKCGSSASSNFPTLFNTIDNRFKSVANGGHVQSANGYDIRPYTDLSFGTPLSYELERYNPTTGEVIMWAKLPTLSATTNTTYGLGYNDPTLTTDGSSATNTFSNGFTSVFHFKDGTTLSILDALGNMVVTTSASPTAAAGLVDGASNFVAASSQYLETPSTAPASAAFTLSTWVKATTLPNNYNPATINRGFSSTDYYGLYIKSTGKLYCVVQATGVVSYDGTGTLVVSQNTWTYVAMTYDSVNGLKGYVNGSPDVTVAANGAANTSAIAGAMGRQRSTTSLYWNGLYDEQRYATVVRSRDWLTQEYNNQGSPSTFYSLGSEVTFGGPSSSRGFFKLAGR